VGIMTKEESLKLKKLLNTPIDLEQLEKDGVIKKKGWWYIVNDMKALPEYASRQINEIKSDNKGNTLVRFLKQTKKLGKDVCMLC
jgi:hypothetical protein